MIRNIFIFMLSLVFITSCSNIDKKQEEITVRFYGWSGDTMVNSWLDNYVKDTLKEEFNINFERVGMDITDIISILSNEKATNKQKGDIDIVWINGANFATAKEYGILQEIDVDNISNYSKNIDSSAPYLYTDFGESIDNYEVPFGIAQFTFIANTKNIDTFTSSEELLSVAKNNPGKVTYPAATDFTGSAFIRNICYDIVGYEEIENASSNKEELRTLLKPAFDYLNELKPYLWQNGETYPKEETILQKMYQDGQLNLTMSYTALLAQRNVEEGIFPNTSKSFVFESGNIGNSHYLAIPFNSPNTEAAHTVINFLLSVEAQASKLDLSNWGDLPVLTYSKLTDEDKIIFDKNNVSQENLEAITKNSLPEVSGEKTVIINELWEEEVLKK